MDTIERAVPRVRFTDSQIEMAHGAGGKASRRLVEGLFVPLLSNPILETLSDAAISHFNGVADCNDRRRLRRQAAAFPRWVDR